ncbi:hypothetical protein [Leucothrix pacifica]|uniref:Uncharacterized protein n=1 Tax=Leucothrix pacifica TaxID=1247513 RepID=A0A317CMW3_9GAMM|nr:hypothetical protein [Leucothrix pacifica]PWQ99888.1 hypothetical protein DKW60_04270 [Leucothrix pacifica]
MDRYTPKPQTVTEAKQRLLAVQPKKPDYLESIKKHPAASVGVAVAAGIMARSVVKNKRLPPGFWSLGMFLLKKL